MEFRDHLLATGLSRRTAAIYCHRVRHVEGWLADEGGSLAEATATDLARYADTLPNSTSTRRHLRSSLAWWWGFTGREGPPLGAVRVPPKPDMLCRALEEPDAQLLAKAALGWWPEGAAVLLGLYLALRREEIAQARWDRFDGGEWYTVQGKFGRVATLPVHPVLREELRDRRNGLAYLFPGARGRPHVCPTTIWTWTRRVAEAAGVGLVPPHRLRHTALATANDRTDDLRAVAAFARHRRVETTMGYTRTTARQLQAVSDSLDYLG